MNNPLEDITPPEYVAGSARLSLARATVEGHDVQVIHAAWGVTEDNAMQPYQGCYVSLNDEVPSTYRFEKYGDFNPADGRCHVDVVMPDYMPSSVYSLNYIFMWDAARNKERVYFTDEASDSDGSWQTWAREYCASRRGQPRDVDEQAGAVGTLPGRGAAPRAAGDCQPRHRSAGVGAQPDRTRGRAHQSGRAERGNHRHGAFPDQRRHIGLHPCCLESSGPAGHRTLPMDLSR